jgi:predicted RNase H-like HicB family nuclease
VRAYAVIHRLDALGLQLLELVSEPQTCFHESRATVTDVALTFNAVYEDAGKGWVYVHVPELPEVHTQGESLEHAREMVREAIEIVLEDRRERGEPIPERRWALVETVEIAA